MGRRDPPDFLKGRGKHAPKVDRGYYDSRPLAFDASAKKQEFQNIERDITRQLGQFNPVGQIMRRMCKEYRMVIRMLEARGTPDLGLISQNSTARPRTPSMPAIRPWPTSA